MLVYTPSQQQQVNPELRDKIKRPTRGTHRTRCSSAFFSSASLFNTARMLSCSSFVRKLKSIMMAPAALQLSSALGVWLAAGHDQDFTRSSSKLSVAVVYIHRIVCALSFRSYHIIILRIKLLWILVFIKRNIFLWTNHRQK